MLESVRRAPVTWSILVLCVLLFALDYWLAQQLQAAVGSGRTFRPLLLLGGVNAHAVGAGQWWRLFTAGFLHFDLIHLALNGFALFQAGQLVERVYGSRRFITLFLAANVAGNLLAYVTTLGGGTLTAGASGAVMGTFGAMAVVAFRFRLARDLMQQALVPIGMTLFYGFTHPGISNAGHIGGLAGGAVAAALLGTAPAWTARMRAAEAQLLRDADAAAQAERAGAGMQEAGGALNERLPEALEPWTGPDELELRASDHPPGRSRGMALLCGVLALGSLMMLVTGLNDSPSSDAGQLLIGAGGLLLFGGGAVVLWRGQTGASILLTREGFTTRAWRGSRTVRWADVEEFGVRTMTAGYGSHSFVAYRYRPEYAFRQSGRSWSGFWATGEQQVAPVMDVEQQARIMEEWRRHWGHHAG